MASWDGVTLTDYATILRIGDWHQFQTFVHVQAPGDNWIFRGQSDSSWRLRPSLERVALYPIPLPSGETRELIEDAYFVEDMLQREFARRAHHFIPDPPGRDESIEWLALMQHHGVPTRFLDWTRSPYVALYFAVSEVQPGTTCSVWAIDAKALNRACGLSQLVPDDAAAEDDDRYGSHWLRTNEEFLSVCFDSPRTTVIPLEPFRMNERLTIQQGLFLCPANLAIPFESTLCAVLRNTRNTCLFRLDIPSEMRLVFLQELNRMNINHATLFPGLDGLGASLRNSVRVRFEIMRYITSNRWPAGR